MTKEIKKQPETRQVKVDKPQTQIKPGKLLTEKRSDPMPGSKIKTSK